MAGNKFSKKQLMLLVLPPVLIESMLVVYQCLTRRFGPILGYFLSFVIYWLGWCLLIPLWLLGPAELAGLFKKAVPRLGKPGWAGGMSLALPVILSYGYEFPLNLPKATQVVVLASFPLALINALSEEVL